VTLSCRDTARKVMSGIAPRIAPAVRSRSQSNRRISRRRGEATAARRAVSMSRCPNLDKTKIQVKSIRLSPAILPVDPVDGMARQVRVHCFAKRSEEGVLDQLREESESFQLVFHWMPHLGKAELEPRLAQ